MCCISPGVKSHAVWSCLAGHDNSEVFGFLPGRNPICVDFSRGEMRTCCISPGEKRACVAFLPGGNRMLFGVAPLPMIIPRFLDFSRGEIDMCGFLLGRNAPMLHSSRGETRMCCISPGEKLACVTFLPRRNRMLFGVAPLAMSLLMVKGPGPGPGPWPGPRARPSFA